MSHGPAHYGAVRRVFNEPIDISSYDSVTLKARSDNPKTQAHVKVAISNGTTTFATVTTGKLSHEAQEFTFSIVAGDMVRSDGDEPFAEVMTNVQLVGLDFISGVDAYSEAIIFDDFVLHQPANELSSIDTAADDEPQVESEKTQEPSEGQSAEVSTDGSTP